VDQIKRRLKPGEDISVTSSAVEIYNEELRDLCRPLRDSAQAAGWDSAKSSGQQLKLQARRPGRMPAGGA